MQALKDFLAGGGGAGHTRLSSLVGHVQFPEAKDALLFLLSPFWICSFQHTLKWDKTPLTLSVTAWELALSTSVFNIRGAQTLLLVVGLKSDFGKTIQMPKEFKFYFFSGKAGAVTNGKVGCAPTSLTQCWGERLEQRSRQTLRSQAMAPQHQCTIEPLLSLSTRGFSCPEHFTESENNSPGFSSSVLIFSS